MPHPAFHQGLTEVERYFYEFDDATLTRAVAAFRAATEADPGHVMSWSALGFALDAAGRPEAALAALRRAATLDPTDHDVEVFVMTLLSEGGAEAAAMGAVEAAADRQGVDLAALREELAAAGMPTDVHTLILNGFIRARNFLRSRLEDEIERMRKHADAAGWARLREAEEKICEDMLLELEREVDGEHVPAEFRAMTAWAARLGLGDDYCRARMAEGLAPEERAEVREAVREHASDIQAWLDTFEPGSMPPEAAAFMYLLLSVEEMDPAP
ncbi:MAG: hypothetical protein AMXMBFR53_25080 [Gemmatimonadota bacterium]